MGQKPDLDSMPSSSSTKMHQYLWKQLRSLRSNRVKTPRTKALRRLFYLTICFLIILLYMLTNATQKKNEWEKCNVVEDKHLYHSFPEETMRADISLTWNLLVPDGTEYSLPALKQPFLSLNDSTQEAIKDAEVTAGNVVRQVACRSEELRTIRLYSSHKRDKFLVEINISCSNGESENFLVGLSRSSKNSCTISYAPTPEPKHLHLILAYSRREERLREFLGRFADLMKRPGNEHVSLIIGSPGDEARFAAKMVTELDLVSNIEVIQTGTDAFGDFSKSVAVQTAISSLNRNHLIGILDLELRIEENYFHSCRVNVVQGSQVWFPVMFSAFLGETQIANGTGVWLDHGFWPSCFYRSDFDAVGGFRTDPETEHRSRGAEDDAFVKNFREHPAYAIFRSYEPDLFHVWP